MSDVFIILIIISLFICLSELKQMKRVKKDDDKAYQLIISDLIHSREVKPIEDETIDNEFYRIENRVKLLIQLIIELVLVGYMDSKWEDMGKVPKIIIAIQLLFIAFTIFWRSICALKEMRKDS